MKLRIGTDIFDFFTSYRVKLQYDSVASIFSFKARFNPDNPVHRKLFKPLSYLPVEVEQDGELLITGTILNTSTSVDNKQQLINVSGYSKTGVIEDCEIPTSSYPLQSDGRDLGSITAKLLQPFGLTVIVTPNVASIVSRTYPKSTANEKQKIKGYLSELASQRDIVITHNELGQLVLTQANTTALPIAKFTEGMPGVKISLDVNGQRIHSQVTVIRQADIDGGNAGQSTVNNPLVPIFRPTTKRQSSGNDIATSEVAKNIRSKELKNIKVVITLDRNSWQIAGQKVLVRPNNTVTVLSPNNQIFKESTLFVESVDYTGDSTKDIAVLTCVLPETYNSNTPKDIFG